MINILSQKTFLQTQVPSAILLLTAAYICGGAWIFQLIEQPQPSEKVNRSLILARNEELSVVNISDNEMYSASGEWFDNKEGSESEHSEMWRFGSTVLFTFSIVTTIGYGHIAPGTTAGKIFCIIYAMIGVPVGMLGIANIGRFVSRFLLFCWQRAAGHFQELRGRLIQWKYFRKVCCSKQIRYKIRLQHKTATALAAQRKRLSDGLGAAGHLVGQEESLPPGVVLVLFTFWIFIGGAVLPMWESIDAWDACYFAFISMTTIGLGDIYPKHYSYFALTYVYLMCGLVLTTMAIEVMSNYLRFLHNLGRQQLKGARKTRLWFGGRSISTHDLLNQIMNQLPIEENVIAKCMEDLDALIENALDAAAQAETEQKEMEKKQKQIIAAQEPDDSDDEQDTENTETLKGSELTQKCDTANGVANNGCLSSDNYLLNVLRAFPKLNFKYIDEDIGSATISTGKDPANLYMLP